MSTSDNVLVSGSATCARLYSGKLRCTDVMLGASIGGAHLKPEFCRRYPGNKRYLAILRKHHKAFLEATTEFDRRLIVRRVTEEIRKADPPARFIARCFGFQQWLGMNDDAVVKMIQHDLLHNLIVTKTANELYTTTYNSQPRQPNTKAQLVRTVSPGSCVEEEDEDEDTTTTPMKHAPPPAVSSNVAELLQLPCMAAERSRLSDYNQFLLSSIELFQATEVDVAASRNGRVTLGQLGLRCRYCERARSSSTGATTSYSTSFPGRLAVMEFNYFHIAGKHFIGGACVHIPSERRSRILAAKSVSASQTRKRGGTGIQVYFNQVAFLCGIHEDTTHGGLKLWTPPTLSNETANEGTNKGASRAPGSDASTTACNYDSKEAVMLADVHTSITETAATYSSVHSFIATSEETKKSFDSSGMTE